MIPLVATEAQQRLAPCPRGGRDCARTGGAGRAQAGSQANRPEGDTGHAPGKVASPAIPFLAAGLTQPGNLLKIHNPHGVPRWDAAAAGGSR